MNEEQKTINRLVRIACGDTGGSKRVAQFLLSHWNGDTFKASLSDLLYVDRELFDDMLNVMTYFKDTGNYLYTYITQEEIDPVIEMWGDTFRTEK